MLQQSSRTLRRRRRARGHVCPKCHTAWALTGVPHPAGFVVLCRVCRQVVASVPRDRDQLAVVTG